MNETELVEIYARTWNTLNADVLAPYLSDDVVFESQVILTPLVGKTAVLDYIVGKMNTIRKSEDPNVEVFAEIGQCGTQNGYRVQLWTAPPGRPCVLIAQGDRDDILAVILLEVKDGMIARVDTCTIVPHPSSAVRTGVYPK